MPDNLKRKTLAFFILAVIVTVLIAAALPALDLQPGIPLPFQRDASGTIQADSLPQVSISMSTFLKSVLGFILVLVGAYFGYKLIRGVPWKQILVPASFLAILTFVIVAILFLFLNVHTNFDFSTPDVLPPAVNITPPALGPLPAGLLWLVWGGLAALIVLLGIWLIRWRVQASRTDNPFELEAQQALQALQSGSDLYDVIVRCYLQMSQALQKDQGIEREQAMTAREFEQLLESRGFPFAPVHQLTSLFENARYGHRRPAPGDEQKAIDSLQLIVQYSRANRTSN